jgi:hypothetical protein
MSSSKVCPKCKLISPEIASRCDCGYDFAAGEMRQSFIEQKSRKSPISLLRRGIGILFLVLAGAWFLFGAFFMIIPNDENLAMKAAFVLVPLLLLSLPGVVLFKKWS